MIVAFYIYSKQLEVLLLNVCIIKKSKTFTEKTMLSFCFALYYILLFLIFIKKTLTFMFRIFQCSTVPIKCKEC